MRRVSRRRFVRTATALLAAVAAAVPLTIAAPGTAAAAVDGLTCTSTAPLYSVTPAGNFIRRNVDNPADATQVPEPFSIDTGWDRYPRVLAGGKAQFYGIKSDGLFVSHRDYTTETWDVHHKRISDGFTRYRLAENRHEITVDQDSNIWHVDDGGDLRWSQYSLDTNSWNPAGDRKIDSGWGRYDLIVATDLGVLYGRDAATGHLLRSRYDFDSQRWLQRHETVSWADWRGTQDVTSFGGDTMVRVQPNGDLRYFRYAEDQENFAVYNRLIADGAHWAGYTSVSGGPASCRLTADHSPARPSISIDADSPAAIQQSPGGAIEYAYTDNIGRLVHGRQSDPNDFNSTQWTTISGNEAFSGIPSLAAQPDGQTALTAQSINSDIWWTRHAQGNPDWDEWFNLAGAMAEHPVTGTMPDGRLVQFSVDAQGKPWYRIQQRPNVAFMGWMPLTGQGLSSPFTVATVRDGVQLFGVDATGRLRTAAFTGSAVGAWTDLGDAPVTGRPSVVVYPGYRMGVFARAADGRIVSLAQATEGSAFPAGWTQVGDFTSAGSPSAVISPITGVTELVARGADGMIYNTGEQTQGSGTWRPWRQEAFEESATDPTTLTYSNANGPTWAFSYRTSANQTRLFEARPTAARAASGTGAPAAPGFAAHRLPAPPGM